MPAPSGPHVKKTYAKDGTMKQEAVGLPGGLCDVATKPYEAAHGGTFEKTPTADAQDPPVPVQVDESVRA